MFDICKAVAQWVLLLVANVILDTLGIFVVAAAIPFRVPGISGSDGRQIVNLPRWAWLFGNDYDGLLGDKRGWWKENCDASVFFGVRPLLRKLGLSVSTLNPESFLAMWWWAAIRNPVNNMRFVKLWQAPVKGSTITYVGDYTVRDHPGEAGWQFVITENDGKRWYGFYLVHQWSETRAFVIRLGFKVQPDDAGTDGEPVGMTTKINFYKAI